MAETLKSCHFPHSDSAVWLVDNGSLRAESILALRRQAVRLGIAAGMVVEAVSVLHSNKVAAQELGGLPAPVFTAHLRACEANGLRRLLVLPYFFGPSAALTEYLPLQIARVQREFPDLKVHIAPSLVDLSDPRDDAPTQIATLLATQVAAVLRQPEFAGKNTLPSALLVDHGSPQSAVSAVRDRVGALLKELLGKSVRDFAVCSMEARAGAHYAHTLPLLEEVLGREPFCNGTVIAAPLFLGPGRHAGAGGDLQAIAKEVCERHCALRVIFCPLPGDSSTITDILLRRLQAGMDKA